MGKTLCAIIAPPQQGPTLILRRRPPLRKLWCSVWYLCRFCRQFCFQRNSAAPSASRHGIQRPSANAADPFCIWRLHGCRLQNCWLQGFRLQAAGPQAAGLQAAKVGLQAAGWTWAVRGKGLRRCTVAFLDSKFITPLARQPFQQAKPSDSHKINA